MNIKNENQETSLSTIHFETQEWLREIQYYQDELTYQYDLIIQMIGSASIDELQHKDIFRNINSLLDNLTNNLSIRLQSHQSNLLEAMRTIKHVDREMYIIAHTTFSKQMKNLKNGILELREAIHKYIDENRIIYRKEVLDLDV